MADTDFHVIHPNVDSCNDDDMNAEMNPTLSMSNIKSLTDLVNKQTLKGYKAGYNDGFAEGIKTDNIFTFGYGIAVGLSLAGITLLLISNK